MKTSAVLTSALFGALAVAAPFDKRALVYKTEVVTETVVVYTTVYDDEPVAQATTTPAGYFYEQPKVSSSTVVSSSSSSSSVAPAAPVYTPAPAPSSSVYVAPSPAPVPTPSSSAAPAPAPQQPSPAPAPVSSAAPQEPAYTPAPQPTPTPSPVAPAPAPAPSAPAPSPVNPPSSGGGSGSGDMAGDITIYEPNGAAGACGKNLGNEEMVVALSKDTWGASTYDVMTGASSNPWCGQKIKAFYNGRSVEATIMDMCPGCSGQDIDLSPAAWRQLTGSDEKTRYKATWTKVN